MPDWRVYPPLVRVCQDHLINKQTIKQQTYPELSALPRSNKFQITMRVRAKHNSQPMTGLPLTSVRALFARVTSHASALLCDLAIAENYSNNPILKI